MLQILKWCLICGVFGAPVATQSPTDGNKTEPFLFLVGPMKIQAEIGSDVTLLCTFQMHIPVDLNQLTVAWEKDRTLILFQNNTHSFPPNTGIGEERLLRRNVSLVLTKVNRGDSGKYTCTIKHGMLEAKHSINLRVPGKENLRGKDISRSEGDMELMRSVSDRPEDKHRPLKIGLVMGAIGASFTMAFLLFICYKP